MSEIMSVIPFGQEDLFLKDQIIITNFTSWLNYKKNDDDIVRIHHSNACFNCFDHFHWTEIKHKKGSGNFKPTCYFFLQH